MGFIDPQWLSFEHFERNRKRAIERPGEPRHSQNDPFNLFGDTVEELSRWDVGRNNSCPCGSGEKFKKCCLGR
jgi:uncharacterized protein YecA (UPF0149 family)